MTDPRLEDHVTGLELQIVELVEQRERARVQGDTAALTRIEAELSELQSEMAATAEQIADD